MTTNSIIATRGCGYNCAFCSDHRYWGKLRRRSVNNIVNEIEDIISRYPKTERIDFFDATLTFSKRFLKDLCSEIVKRNIKLKFRATARFDNLDDEVLTSLRKAGFDTLCLGAESGDPDILKSINKKIGPDFIKEKLRLIKKHGIRSVAFILVGVPGETEESLKNTISLMKNCEADVFDVNCFVPLPGSDWHHELPDRITKNLKWVDLTYKGIEPYLFQVDGKHDLYKYVKQINRIADHRLLMAITKTISGRFISSILPRQAET